MSSFHILCFGIHLVFFAGILSCSGQHAKITASTEGQAPVAQKQIPVGSNLPDGISDEYCKQGKKEFVDFLFLFDDEDLSKIQDVIEYPLVVASSLDFHTDCGYFIFKNTTLRKAEDAKRHLKSLGCDVLMDLSVSNIEEEVKCRYANNRYFFSTYCNGDFPLYVFERKQKRMVLVGYDLLYDGIDRGFARVPKDVVNHKPVNVDQMAQFFDYNPNTDVDFEVTINGRAIEHEGIINDDFFTDGYKERNIISVKIQNSSLNERTREFRYGVTCFDNYYTLDNVFDGKQVKVDRGESKDFKVDLNKIGKDHIRSSGTCKRLGHFFLYEKFKESDDCVYIWLPVYLDLEK